MSTSFLDNQNRKWNLHVNVGSIRRVRSMCGIDLAAALDGKTLQRLSEDPVLAVDVIAALIYDDLKNAGITDEDFACSLSSDNLDAAVVALLHSIAEFFPDPKKSMLLKLINKVDQQQKELTKMMMQEMDQKIESLDLRSSFGALSTQPQELSESTQAG